MTLNAWLKGSMVPRVWVTDLVEERNITFKRSSQHYRLINCYQQTLIENCSPVIGCRFLPQCNLCSQNWLGLTFQNFEKYRNGEVFFPSCWPTRSQKQMFKCWGCLIFYSQSNSFWLSWDEGCKGFMSLSNRSIVKNKLDSQQWPWKLTAFGSAHDESC